VCWQKSQSSHMIVGETSKGCCRNVPKMRRRNVRSMSAKRLSINGLSSKRLSSKRLVVETSAPLSEQANGEKSHGQSINHSVSHSLTHPAYLMPREPKLSPQNKVIMVFPKSTCQQHQVTVDKAQTT